MTWPFPTEAASAAAVLGSISSYGAVEVGEIPAPQESTLFTGDLVNTRSGSAVIQYKQGTRVLLAMHSLAQFSATDVHLQKGQMSFRSPSEKGTVFHASSLLLEPAAANSSANVELQEGKATVSVTEGVLRVVDPTGAELGSIKAGETRLFAKASAAPASPASSPSPAPAAPQMFAGGPPVWVLVLAGAGVAVTTALAITLNNNASDNAAALSPSK